MVFVGVSISLPRILEIPNITHRAINGLSFLLLMLFVSLMGLVPGQPIVAIGLEILLFAIADSILVLSLDRALIKTTPQEYKKLQFRNLLLDQLVVLPYVIASIILICGNLSGIYILIPAFIFSFTKALVDAWVLLIEIHH